jgi:molybdate transport system substrate-binding protein
MTSGNFKLPWALFAALAAAFVLVTPTRAEDLGLVRVFAAGSLRAAMDQIADLFAIAANAHVQTVYGPSGVLRERIEKGEHADLFASADMGNPVALSRTGKSGPAILFARNRLCAMVRPGMAIEPATLLAKMLDPRIKLGTSTPKADPAGDYTWAMFAKADAVRPGSRALLEAKALQLMGGAASAAPPAGLDLFAWHLREKHADIFVAYCSAGANLKKDLPGASVVNLPPALATGADYGLTWLPATNERGVAFALFMFSDLGQQILARNGFYAPLLSPEKR